MEDFQTSGWLIRFTESRDGRVRCLAWDLLTEIFDYEFFKQNQTLCWQAIQGVMREAELYCVKISILKFLNKLCGVMAQNCMLNDDSSQESLTVKQLLDAVSRQGLISQVHLVLCSKDAPLMMIGLLMKFLAQVIRMDFKRALPILTQLDYWTLLVEMLNVEALAAQDSYEDREALSKIKGTLLSTPVYQYDAVYFAVNEVLEFLFESMKKDPQMANLLCKTTRMLP